MVVEITVDDRNISLSSPGMAVELTDYWKSFMGTVTSINMSVGGEQLQRHDQLSRDPEVDNFGGTLLAVCGWTTPLWPVGPTTASNCPCSR